MSNYLLANRYIECVYLYGVVWCGPKWTRLNRSMLVLGTWDLARSEQVWIGRRWKGGAPCGRGHILTNGIMGSGDVRTPWQTRYDWKHYLPAILQTTYRGEGAEGVRGSNKNGNVVRTLIWIWPVILNMLYFFQLNKGSATWGNEIVAILRFILPHLCSVNVRRLNLWIGNLA